MVFRQLFDPQSSTYTYLLGDEETKAAVVIDPVKERLEELTRVGNIQIEIIETPGLMNNLNLPRPKKIDLAVPANLRCGLEPLE